MRFLWLLKNIITSKMRSLKIELFPKTESYHSIDHKKGTKLVIDHIPSESATLNIRFTSSN